LVVSALRLTEAWGPIVERTIGVVFSASAKSIRVGNIIFKSRLYLINTNLASIGFASPES
jgi:hypothetical protein